MKQESGGGELPTASRFERPVARWRMWLGFQDGLRVSVICVEHMRRKRRLSRSRKCSPARLMERSRSALSIREVASAVQVGRAYAMRSRAQYEMYS